MPNSSPNGKVASHNSVKEKVSLDHRQEDVIIPRTIGFPGASSFIIGSIIGSGIFISPSGVALGSGSVAMCIINWFLYGVVAMLGGLSYAELAIVVQESGADYAVLQKVYGSLMPYMFAWVTVFISNPATMATLALSCSIYILTPVFSDGCGKPPDYIVITLAIFFIFSLAAISIKGTELVTRIAISFTAIKVSAMIIIIIGGVITICRGHVENLKSGFEDTQSDLGKIVLGFYSGMWAYGGWDTVNYITEDIKKPRRNIPLSIFTGLIIVTVIYVLVNISYLTIMPISELLTTPAAAVTWATRVIPRAAWIIPILVACSTFGSGNSCLFTTGRVALVASRNGHLPDVFGMVHVERHTPTVTYIITVILAVICVLAKDVRTLIEVIGFVRWIFYGFCMVALIIFRYKTKYRHVERSFYLPLFVPVIVLCVSIFVVVVSIVLDPSAQIVVTLCVIGVGLVFYMPFVYFKLRLPYFDVITEYLQITLQISKSQKFEE